MSNARFSIIQARAVRDERITPAQFRTLCALGIYGNEEGWCFPNLKTLGDDLNKSKQAVSKDIKALVELGYIEVKYQYRDDGSQRGNLYRLIFDVDGGQLNTVDGGQLNTVDAITPHINAPCNDTNNDKSNDIGGAKLQDITSLFGLKNDSAFETMLTTTQKVKFKNSWDTNPDKCVTIALYYANEGLTFQKTIGKIINNFDTWRDSKKQKPPEDYFAN